MSKIITRRWLNLGIPGVIGGIFLLTLPLLFCDYCLHIFIIALLNITLALGMRMLYVTNQVSFCHVTFYALGAYTSTLLVMKFGLSFGISFLAAGILPAVTAALLMLAIARVKGVYFFLVSFGFLGVMDSMLRYWRDLTGGVSGIKDIPPIMDWVTVTPYYYVVVVFTVLTILIMYRIHKSRLGGALMAIGEAEDLAEVSGINVFRYRVLAFAIGALFAGFAGSLFAHYSSFITSRVFSMWFTISILIWVVIGGPKKFWGPIAGAVVMTFIAEFLRMSGTMQAVLYAAALLAAIMAMPQGIAGLVDTLRARFGKRRYPGGGTKLGAELLTGGDE